MPLEEIGITARFEVDGEKKVERALDDINKKVEKTERFFKNLAQTLVGMRRPYDQIVRVTGEAAAATAEYGVNTERADEVLKQLNTTTQRSARETKQIAAAIDKSTAARERAIKKLALWTIGSASAFRVIQRLRRLIQDSIEDVFGVTKEWENFEEAMTRVRRAIIISLVPYDDMLELLDRGAVLANKFADNMLTLSAIIEGIRAVPIPEFVPKGQEFGFQVAQLLGGEGQEEFSAAFNARLEENQRALDSAEDSAIDYSKAISSLVDATARFDQELERNAQSLAKVNEQFGQAQAAATGKLFTRLHDIQVNFQKDVAKIDAAALKSRARAFANFERQITEMQQREVDNRERLRQQNQLQREFATRRFQLSQIQSERQFQSDRGFLVAEGDVLAIERLDERHRIEQLDREENFRLQEQQTEAMFRLQLRFQEQAMRQQIAALGTALRAQLASIEENRQERIAAQKELAEEERMEAKQAFGAQIADALAAQIEQTNNLKTQLAEREKAMAESLANLIRANDLAAPQVLEGWRKVYGPNGEFDRLVNTALSRATLRTIQFGNVLGGIGGSGGGGGRRLPFLPPGTLNMEQSVEMFNEWLANLPPINRRAMGGNDVVTRPTLFMAGEAGPERIITQPLGNVGGNISVSWRGGAIPVQGQGLQGADVSGLGDSIVEGLMIRMSNVIQNARGVR